MAGILPAPQSHSFVTQKVLTVPQQFRTLLWVLLVVFAVLAPRSSHAIGTILLDQATLSLGTSELSLNRIELNGAETSPTELKALFSSASPDEFQERLKRFSASSLKIGELKQTQTMMGEVSTSITRNLEIIGISNGVATLIRAEGGIFGGTSDANGSHSGTFGAYTLSDVDIPLFIRVSYGRKSMASDVFAQAYTSATVENIAFSPATGPSATIASLSAKNVRFKEIDGGVLTLVERISNRNFDEPEMSDADKIALVLDYLTLTDTISIGSLDIVGFGLKSPDENEVTINVGRIAFSGATNEAGATLRMEGFDVSAPDGKVKIGSISQTGFDISPTLDKIRAELSEAGAKLEDIELQNVMPVLGQFELRDAAFETGQPAPVKAGVRSIAIVFDNPDGGVPVGLKWTLDGLFGPFPTDPNDEISQTMISLGYRDFDLSSTAELLWNTPRTELSGNLAVSGANMGSLSATAQIGGVSQEQLITNPSSALITAMAATLKAATIEIENRGLAERLIDQDAVKTKRSPEQVKKAYASVAAASLQLYLGANETAMRLTRSIVRFIENPTKFSITAQSKNKAGVGIADTTLAEEPGAIIDLFDITTSSD